MMTLLRWRTFLAALAALAVPMTAQTIRSINIEQPKRDRLEEFRSAIADYNAALKKAGATTPYTMWSSQSGDSQYLQITDYEKWADLDKSPFAPQNYPAQASEIALADQRIRDANLSQRRVILRLVPDAGLPLTGENPPMMIARWVRLAGPGHGQEYTAAIKTDLLPSVRKAGIKSFSLWQVWFGTEQSQYLSLIALDKWASLDQSDPIVAAMGNEAYQRYGNKTTPMIAQVREDVYRFRPELSYLPSPAKK
jgi:hypothetical protein